MLNLSLLEQQHKTRLGDLLVKRGVISPQQLSSALAEQKYSTAPLGEILVQLGYISKRQLTRNLGRQSLLRATALTATILLSPLASTSAVAATQGTLGATSSAQVQITLRIPPRIEVSGLDTIFYNAQHTVLDDFCIRGRGIDGFELSSQWSHSQSGSTPEASNPNYQVSYNGETLSNGNLSNSQKLSHRCAESQLAIKNPNAGAGNSSSVLTLTIAPQ